jgi:RimJ/RimL family protein N-acetyltransferase
VLLGGRFQADATSRFVAPPKLRFAPMPARRFRVEWSGAQGVLAAVEPTLEEVRARAGELSAAYNDPHNSRMMANTIDFSAADVVANFEEMAEEGARQFFLYDGAAFAGDADLRNISARAAELAILIAARPTQGKGLGTRFATLLHVFAFRGLALERLYVTILPENVASRRVFEKLGYSLDPSPDARAYADDPRDLSMSIARGDFERAHPAAMAEVRIDEA